jgi:hypothetical protein
MHNLFLSLFPSFFHFNFSFSFFSFPPPYLCTLAFSWWRGVILSLTLSLTIHVASAHGVGRGKLATVPAQVQTDDVRRRLGHAVAHG